MRVVFLIKMLIFVDKLCIPFFDKRQVLLFKLALYMAQTVFLKTSLVSVVEVR